jgi:hypothetical protein
MIKRLNKTKKAQGGSFGMSFGMIFSIILIIFFVMAAFFGIKKFLEFQSCAKVGAFSASLDDDLYNAWNSQTVESPLTNKNLPGKVDYVCFYNVSKDASLGEFEQELAKDLRSYRYSGENMFLIPLDSVCKPDHKMKYIYLEKITQTKNPMCFPVEKGIAKFEIVKNFGEPLVRIE